MPYTPKAIADALRHIDPSLPIEQQAAAVKQYLGEAWHQVNRPLVGAPDAIIPQFRHTHSPDEGVVRRTAEDIGAKATSPLSLGLTAASLGTSGALQTGLNAAQVAADVAPAADQTLSRAFQRASGPREILPTGDELAHNQTLLPQAPPPPTGQRVGELTQKLGGRQPAAPPTSGLTPAQAHALSRAAKEVNASPEEVVRFTEWMASSPR